MREIYQSGEHREQNKYNENKVIRRKISYYGKIKSAIYHFHMYGMVSQTNLVAGTICTIQKLKLSPFFRECRGF